MILASNKLQDPSLAWRLKLQFPKARPLKEAKPVDLKILASLRG